MKIWFISDTHCQHTRLIIPTGVDMVIHCGDESHSIDRAINESEAVNFLDWFSSLPIRHKVFIAGNHSTAIFNGLVRPEKWPIHYLNHELREVAGIKIFGSPYTPAYGRCGAFGRPRNRMELIWSSVPECDILVTHGPPKYILDTTLNAEDNFKSITRVGDKSLYNRVMELRPRVHAFGHIHDEAENINSGMLIKDDIIFINCSCSTIRMGDKFNNGSIIEI